MRIFFLIIFLALFGNSYAQNNYDNFSKTIGDGIYVALFKDDLTNDIVSKKPLGRNVSIFYDAFFESYIIIYTDEQGIKNRFYFKKDFGSSRISLFYPVDPITLKKQGNEKYTIDTFIHNGELILAIRNYNSPEESMIISNYRKE